MRRITIALLLLGSALPASARDISGQVSYLQRIALDPAAQLVVELTGPSGLTGEFREDAEGRQVPLPFTVSTDDTGAQFLRAAILVGGAAQWVTPPIPAPAGDEPLDLGMITMGAFVPMGFTSQLRCGDTLIDVGFIGDEARMRLGGTVYSLPLAVSASGARFSDGQTPETMIWTKGNTALVTIAGWDLPECQATAMPSALPFTARGNEPGWVLNVSGEGMVLAMQDGTEIRTSLPAAEDGPDGTVFATDQLIVTVAPEICRDTMTGMPHPLGVAVQAGEQVLQGCGGNPADLLQGNWVVQGIDGTPLPAEAEVTMAFSGDRVYGKSACNRYNAGVHLTGEALVIEPGPMTMMACDEVLMSIERSFIGALQGASAFDFDTDSGALILMAEGRPVVTAVPAP